MVSETLKPLILVSHAIPDPWMARLTARYAIEMGPADTIGIPEALLQEDRHATGLITLLMDKVDAAVLDKLPDLKVLCNFAAGVDNIDLEACTRRGIPVGNTPGVLTNATADLTLTLILAAVRRISQAQEDARLGRWKNWAPAGWLGLELTNATLGIIGMGRIGQAVARRAAGFGMHLLYTDHAPLPPGVLDVPAGFVDLDSLLRESDIVSLHVPLTPATRRMMDGPAIQKMKPGAFLINVSRGPVVDMEALTAALKDGYLGGAALDVTDPEPFPADHPLYRMPNCLIVPHIGSATERTRRKMAEITCENMLAGLEGRRLPFCANPDVYASVK
jgi:lactate dehydrogenase-like 2-hydroxyacid dehydrogenase